MFKRIFSAVLGFLVASKLKRLPGDEMIAINPFPRGRFSFYGRTNGAMRKKKTNRLALSKKTRNRHR